MQRLGHPPGVSSEARVDVACGVAGAGACIQACVGGWRLWMGGTGHWGVSWAFRGEGHTGGFYGSCRRMRRGEVQVRTPEQRRCRLLAGPVGRVTVRADACGWEGPHGGVRGAMCDAQQCAYVSVT